MLPKGTRYILNPESERIRKLEDRIISVLNTLGYEEIICPLIEYEDVVREGIGTGYEGIFRLIEPSTGKTMSIREDFTPQIVSGGQISFVYRGGTPVIPRIALQSEINDIIKDFEKIKEKIEGEKEEKIKTEKREEMIKRETAIEQKTELKKEDVGSQIKPHPPPITEKDKNLKDLLVKEKMKEKEMKVKVKVK